MRPRLLPQPAPRPRLARDPVSTSSAALRWLAWLVLPALAAPLIALAAPVAAPPAPTWPGALTLEVDATDLAHRVLHARETIPVAQPGQRLTLAYPRFLPGTHGPWGDVARVAGLVIEGGGRRLAWQRDWVDTHAFHVEVPADVHELTVKLDFLTPAKRGGDTPTITRKMLALEWESSLLYPAGQPVNTLRVRPQLRLPAGWQLATALRAADGSLPRPDASGRVQFGEVALETLVDSPVYAGAHLRRIELEPPGSPRPVALDLMAESDAALAAPTEVQIEAHRALVRQADKLFGQRHWRHYDLLLALSDDFANYAIEHHESSQNPLEAGYFSLDWSQAIRAREVPAHEYVHSWNGKFRRPADLWTPDYQVPMRNSLLWVYEGLTEYWGHVLAARAGLSTPEQARDRLATTAADMLAQRGRAWRSLEDTALSETLGAGHTTEWPDWQRSSDYYPEGLLLWLEVDAWLREHSQGKRSLDDLAQRFFGLAHASNADGSIRPLTYTLEDLAAALNAIAPRDWAALLRDRVSRHDDQHLLDGLARAGWRLSWTDKESSFSQHERGFSGPDGSERPQDLLYSLGFSASSDGKLVQVAWASPGFEAGLAPGMTLLAVNHRAYRAERLAEAVAANLGGKAPIELLLRDGDDFLTVRLDWRGGLRYPALERLNNTTDRLSSIYAPR